MKLAPLALAALALPASSQLASTVGPPTAPTGGFVAISMSNDTATPFLVGQACPFEVHTAAGALVYDIDCPTWAAIPLDPGGTATFWWEQVDNTFTQVPDGDYVVTVELPDGTTPTHPLTIGGTAGGVAIKGVPRLGTTRGFFIQAPTAANLPYLMAASTAPAPGIPTCAGTIPLTPSPLLFLSLPPSSSQFVNFTGALGESGEAGLSFFSAAPNPAVAIPADPTLAGLAVSFAFVSIDSSAPCVFRTISSALTVTLQP